MIMRCFANLTVPTLMFVLGATIGHRCVFQPPSYLMQLCQQFIYSWIYLQYMGGEDSASGGIIDTFCAIN